MATPGSIPARFLRKSHKHESVTPCRSVLPLYDEDMVLDSPWTVSDYSDSESDEEQSTVVGTVMVRKLLTFRVSEEQVVAWKRHNIGELPGFWNKYCGCSAAQVEPVSIDSIMEDQTQLYGGEQDW